jgi:hypothetical protein
MKYEYVNLVKESILENEEVEDQELVDVEMDQPEPEEQEEQELDPGIQKAIDTVNALTSDDLAAAAQDKFNDMSDEELQAIKDVITGTIKKMADEGQLDDEGETEEEPNDGEEDVEEELIEQDEEEGINLTGEDDEDYGLYVMLHLLNNPDDPKSVEALNSINDFISKRVQPKASTLLMKAAKAEGMDDQKGNPMYLYKMVKDVVSGFKSEAKAKKAEK